MSLPNAFACLCELACSHTFLCPQKSYCPGNNGAAAPTPCPCGSTTANTGSSSPSQCIMAPGLSQPYHCPVAWPVPLQVTSARIQQCASIAEVYGLVACVTWGNADGAVSNPASSHFSLSNHTICLFFLPRFPLLKKRRPKRGDERSPRPVRTLF